MAMEEKKAREKLFGEYLEELGICTAEQVEQALGYCVDCSKWGRFIPIGQALVELGYTTMNNIDDVLRMQAKDRATLRSQILGEREAPDDPQEKPSRQGR